MVHNITKKLHDILFPKKDMLRLTNFEDLHMFVENFTT